MNNTIPILINKSAVIVCHDAMFGPPHELRDYLLQHGIRRLLFIGHPNKTLKGNDITSSYFEKYSDGKMVEKHINPVVELPEYIGYVRDSFYTIFWTIIHMGRSTDYFIGLGNLNAFIGLLLRVIGVTNKVFYYVIDYIPNRFSNKLINYFYRWIDQVSALYSDITWNYSKRMIVERNNSWKRKFKNQLVVPNGIHVNTNLYKNCKSVKYHELIYLGAIKKEQGIDIVIRALPTIQKSIHDVKLTIIGKGYYVDELKKLASELRISKIVKFYGYVKDPKDADLLVSQYGLGVAMYDSKSSYVIYTEPGKVKRYLACGVPVIMTNISPIAKDIEKNKCGIICPYSVQSFSEKVISFFKKRNTIALYRRNALKYVLPFDWDKIFTNAFSESK